VYIIIQIVFCIMCRVQWAFTNGLKYSVLVDQCKSVEIFKQKAHCKIVSCY